MPAVIDLPLDLHADVKFTPVRTREIARMEGRRTETVDEYESYWRASVTFMELSKEELGVLDSFFAYTGFFLAFDTGRPRPVAYASGPLSGEKAAGGEFNGDAEINDLTTRTAPVITGLPASFVLNAGDYVEFRVSETDRSLHRIATAVTADDDGIVIPILRTPVPQAYTTAATVHFEKPSCVMQMTSFDDPKTPGVSTYSMEAVEVFPG